MNAQPAIVFVHGMYMNGVSWEPWIERAKAYGFESSGPSWPLHDGPPAQLRANVPTGLGMLTFGAVVDHFKEILSGLATPPVLIGHSIGGLVVQKLINEGFGALGVAISPAPPQGIFTLDPTFFKANFPHINPFAGNKPVIMTPERFQYTFCNTMSAADSKAAFDMYVTPESRNVPRSTLTQQGHVDFARAHAPLLVIAGDSDHLVPQALIEKQVKAYTGPGIVDFKAFDHRSHFICNQDGWEEVADFAFDWVQKHAG
jgi:alpha-beta hydrolase superfamily lysophospholipase